MPDAVLTDVQDRTMVVTINRPEARNAVNQAVWDGLGDALDSAESDPDIWTVVITGAGDRAFCAGADLKAIMNGEFRVGGRPDLRRDAWGFAGVVSHEISKPIIAAVNGFALGGGWEIVLACDLVVAADTATFGLPEVRRGLIAAGGGAFRVARELPRALASELLFTGEMITAQRAKELGLVNAVVAPDEVMATSLELADRINANAPLAVQGTKRIARGIVAGRAPADDPAWWLSTEEMRRVVVSEDAKEGPRAFAEKRQPVWKAR